MSLGDWNLTSRNRRETNCSRRLHMRGSYRKPRLPMENSWMQGSYGAMFEPPRSTRQVKNDMLFRFTSNLVKRKTSTHCVFTLIESLRSCFFSSVSTTGILLILNFIQPQSSILLRWPRPCLSKLATLTQYRLDVLFIRETEQSSF